MAKKYIHLLQPLQIRGVLLKNRMTATMGIPHMLQGPEDWLTEKTITHLANRAKNGAAAVYIPGATRTMGQDRYDMSYPGHNPADNYVCQLIDSIRFYESVAISSPSGTYTRTDMAGPPPQQQGQKFDHSNPEQELRDEQEACRGRSVDGITKAQIQEYIDTTVESALKLKALGIELISMHNAYHNGIVAEFWSHKTNHRTDEYGGSAKNRARLFLEIYDALRQSLGRDVPLESLITAEGLGVDMADTLELAKWAEGLVDILHIRTDEKDPQHPVGFTSSRAVPSPNLAAAAAIKESVSARGGKLLIGVSAGLQNADFNERILADGKADIINMCRAWICDSDYGKKLYSGRGEDVTPCIRCNKCHVPNDSDKWRSFCSVNPKIGWETKLNTMTDAPAKKKKVAVIGGGPAGMQAALTCVERGHDVTLYEKSGSLGGQLFHADYASFKWPLADYKNWMTAQVMKSGAKVLLNTTATCETLESQGYDDVIVAIGPKFERPAIDGVQGKNVWTAIDVYGHENELPHEIVVIGAGETGTETGMYLAEKGHHVTAMTRQNMLAMDAAHAHYVVMLMEAYQAQAGFDYVAKVKKYVSISDTGVTYIDKDGDERFIPCEAVVVSGGVKPLLEEASSFYEAGDHVHFVGDCVRAGDVHKATSSAFAVASLI